MWSENQKIAELQTFIEKNKNIVCKLLAVRNGIATYKYISQGVEVLSFSIRAILRWLHQKKRKV